MKKLLKIAGRIILAALILACIVALGSYYYITTQWKKYYTEDEILVWAKEIEAAPQLSNTFYGIYDKLHHNDRHKSITRIYSAKFWKGFLKNGYSNQTSWHVAAAYLLPKKNGEMGHGSFKLAWALEKFTTPEKCFDFAKGEENKQLRRHDSTFKDVTQLTDTNEVIEYLLKSHSPSRYSHNPELLKEKTEAIKNQLKQ